MNSGSDEFTPISDILCDVIKEVARRAELRSRLEAEMGRPLSDEEFISEAEKTGEKI